MIKTIGKTRIYAWKRSLCLRLDIGSFRFGFHLEPSKRIGLWLGLWYILFEWTKFRDTSFRIYLRPTRLKDIGKHGEGPVIKFGRILRS